MKAIMVMYDSLNRHYLPNYGCDLTRMPNFERLGKHAATFDNCYVGSLPCMPARRELHTGRLNFLHRGWSPLEPFDDSMPEILKENGVYTHLVSDHKHYWADGGATYHGRYNTWENIRGQQGDPWKGKLGPVEVDFDMPGQRGQELVKRQEKINRDYMRREEEFPQAKTFAAGLEFIEDNKGCDNWFVQIETFDPHEPFFTPEEYELLYREEGDTPFSVDWPPYRAVTEEEVAVIGKVKKKYFALLSMCDAYLGKVLDVMDKYDLWKDTMLIINTDHGFLLGEHMWWSKSVMPVYNELANTPLFIWDPRTGVKNEHRKALVQTIDLAPTLLDFFGLDIPKDMMGKPLRQVIERDEPVREYALFGFHGSHISITDGRYVYMRAPLHQENQPQFEYTLMPMRMRGLFAPELLAKSVLTKPFSFTKGSPTLKVPSGGMMEKIAPCYRFGTKLYDLQADPEQLHPIDDPDSVKEAEMIEAMARLMASNDAPAEQYERMGIPAHGGVTEDLVREQRLAHARETAPKYLPEYTWSEEAVWQYGAMVHLLSGQITEPELTGGLKQFLEANSTEQIDRQTVLAYARSKLSAAHFEAIVYTLETVARID